MTTTWHRSDPARNLLLLTLHVQPGAKRTEVAGLHGDALKIRLAVPPVEGRANAELLRFIADALGVPAKQVALKQGERSRRKVVEVRGASRGPAALFDPGAVEGAE
ncbi:MAG: YggU family protein [Betaproteobacteria bacterium]|nr:YggU family protein [Betaproteobacteria bacterium]